MTHSQETPVQFSPFSGTKLREPGRLSDKGWRAGVHVWYFNPWTGSKRNPLDVESDPHGVLIRPAGEVLLADRPKLSKWVPTTDLMTLRRMGKLGEELGELQAVAARVVIQGLDEVDPGTGKVNRQRLLDELADVQAQIGCTLLAFDLDQDYLTRRVAEKIRQMREWEAMFEEAQP